DAAGTASGNGPSGECGPVGYVPSITRDGGFVAFESCATDLVAHDTNGVVDVFVRDLKLGRTILVSANAAGTDTGNAGSRDHSFSGDGRLVAFTSEASDLVQTDRNGAADVFVRDLRNGTTRLVSLRRDSLDSGNAESSHPVMSANGRFVAFRSH